MREASKGINHIDIIGYRSKLTRLTCSIQYNTTRRNNARKPLPYYQYLYKCANASTNLPSLSCFTLHPRRHSKHCKENFETLRRSYFGVLVCNITQKRRVNSTRADDPPFLKTSSNEIQDFRPPMHSMFSKPAPPKYYFSSILYRLTRTHTV